MSQEDSERQWVRNPGPPTAECCTVIRPMSTRSVPAAATLDVRCPDSVQLECSAGTRAQPATDSTEVTHEDRRTSNLGRLHHTIRRHARGTRPQRLVQRLRIEAVNEPPQGDAQRQ
jgi:hypothetical protein